MKKTKTTARASNDKSPKQKSKASKNTYEVAFRLTRLHLQAKTSTMTVSDFLKACHYLDVFLQSKKEAELSLKAVVKHFAKYNFKTSVL